MDAEARARQFNPSQFQVVRGDFRILFANKGKPEQDRTLVKVIKGAIPEQVSKAVYAAFKALMAHKPRQHRRRGINFWSYHVGCWTPRFGKKIVPTANSFDKIVRGIEEFQKTLRDLGLQTLVEKLFKNHFLNLYRKYKAVNGDKNAINKVYKTMAVNIDGVSRPHIDGLDFDDGMCLVLPFGNYEGKILAIVPVLMLMSF